MLRNCQQQSSSRLVGNEGNVKMVAYGKCKCGLTPINYRYLELVCSQNSTATLWTITAFCHIFLKHRDRGIL